MPMGMGSSKQLRSMTGRRALFQGRQQVPNIPRMSGLGQRQAMGPTSSAQSSGELEMPQVPRMATGMESDGQDTTPGVPQLGIQQAASAIQGFYGKGPFSKFYSTEAASRIAAQAIPGGTLVNELGGGIAQQYRIGKALRGGEGDIFESPVDSFWESAFNDPNRSVTPEQNKTGLRNFVAAMRAAEPMKSTLFGQIANVGSGYYQRDLESNRDRPPLQVTRMGESPPKITGGEYIGEAVPRDAEKYGQAPYDDPGQGKGLADIQISGESDVDQREMDYNYEEDEYGD